MDFVIGFCIAVVIALSGVGAGVITAPLLILFLHVPVEIAVSTALAYSAIVKFIVVPVQVIRKQVNYRVLGVMVLGGLPGVILGSILFKHVATHGPKTALYFVLGAIIVFTSGWHLFRHFRPAGIARPASRPLQMDLRNHASHRRGGRLLFLRGRRAGYDLVTQSYIFDCGGGRRHGPRLRACYRDGRYWRPHDRRKLR